MGRYRRNAFFGLLSLWIVYMGGVDGGTFHNVGLRDMTGGMPGSLLRALDFFALRCL